MRHYIQNTYAISKLFTYPFSLDKLNSIYNKIINQIHFNTLNNYFSCFEKFIHYYWKTEVSQLTTISYLLMATCNLLS